MKLMPLIDRKKICMVFSVGIMGLSLFVSRPLISVADAQSAKDQSGSSNVVEEKSTIQEFDQQQPDGEVQERGLGQLTPRKGLRGTKRLPFPPQAGGELPANLCHQETHMLTQCRCFTAADCQVVSTFCPGSCPIGSQSCQCTPMFRGTPPPLPPNLCGYQVPLVVTHCSCSNTADCQTLSTICPGSCPAGSQTCECTPLHRQ